MSGAEIFGYILMICATALIITSMALNAKKDDRLHREKMHEIELRARRDEIILKAKLEEQQKTVDTTTEK